MASIKHDPEARKKYLAHKRAVLEKNKAAREAEAKKKAAANKAEVQ